ncbi:hypothetical protein AAMO2058_000385100, partial [Amorphochlora amoebiformis]
MESDQTKGTTEMVLCPFAGYGCNQHIHKEKLSEHVDGKDAMFSHMLLMMKLISRQNQAIADLSSEVKILKARLEAPQTIPTSASTVNSQNLRKLEGEQNSDITNLAVSVTRDSYVHVEAPEKVQPSRNRIENTGYAGGLEGFGQESGEEREVKEEDTLGFSGMSDSYEDNSATHKEVQALSNMRGEGKFDNLGLAVIDDLDDVVPESPAFNHPPPPRYLPSPPPNENASPPPTETISRLSVSGVLTSSLTVFASLLSPFRSSEPTNHKGEDVIIEDDDRSVAEFLMKTKACGIDVYYTFICHQACDIDKKLSLKERLDVITKVSIQGNNFSTFHAKNLWRLSMLQELNLSNNHLNSITGTMAWMPGLRTLNLSKNYLEALPRGIEKLSRLRRLFIFKNRLMRLPPGIGELTGLLELQAHANDLVGLPAEIKSLVALETLGLRSNHIMTVPDEFKHLQSLVTLDLTDNKLCALPDEVQDLAQLQVLLIGGNSLVRIPSGISGMVSLRRIDLRGNPLLRIVPSDLTKLPCLVDLRVDPILREDVTIKSLMAEKKVCVMLA